MLAFVQELLWTATVATAACTGLLLFLGVLLVLMLRAGHRRRDEQFDAILGVLALGPPWTEGDGSARAEAVRRLDESTG